MNEEKIVREYQGGINRKFSNFFSKISTGQVIIVGIILFAIIGFSNTGNFDKRFNYVMYAVLIGVILIMWFKPEKEKKLLSEYIVKRIAQESLNQKVAEGKEFSFDSKVIVTDVCHLKYENDLISGTSGPTSWDVGFVEFVHGTRFKKDGVISIHPYLGIITGIDFRPLGYTGRESRDRDIIPVGVVQGNVKTTEFGKP